MAVGSLARLFLPRSTNLCRLTSEDQIRLLSFHLCPRKQRLISCPLHRALFVPNSQIQLFLQLLIVQIRFWPV